MKGHIARRYGDLAEDLWSGSSRSLAPLKLRVSSENLHVLKYIFMSTDISIAYWSSVVGGTKV